MQELGKTVRSTLDDASRALGEAAQGTIFGELFKPEGVFFAKEDLHRALVAELDAWVAAGITTADAVTKEMDARLAALGTDYADATRDEIMRAWEGVRKAVSEGVVGAFADTWDEAERGLNIMATLPDAVRRTFEIGGGMARPINEAFQKAVAAIKEGFGGIKAALQGGGPMLIGRRERIENMEVRLRKVMKRLRRAWQVDDPAGVAYWTAAAQTQQARMEKMRRTHQVKVRDIRKELHTAGVGMEGTWLKVQRAGERSAEMIREANRQAITAVEGEWQTLAGKAPALGQDVGEGFATGLRASIPTISAAMAEARMAMAVSAGAGGRPGGDTYQIGTLIADEGGLDQLDRRMARRRRLKSRGTNRYNDPD